MSQFYSDSSSGSDSDSASDSAIPDDPKSRLMHFIKEQCNKDYDYQKARETHGLHGEAEDPHAQGDVSLAEFALQRAKDNVDKAIDNILDPNSGSNQFDKKRKRQRVGGGKGKSSRRKRSRTHKTKRKRCRRTCKGKRKRCRRTCRRAPKRRR